METFLLMVGPVVGIAFLIALPLMSGTGEKSWLRRPIGVLMVGIILVSLAAFTYLGTYAPWSPVMNAWSSAPVPTALLNGRSALERQGAVVLQVKQCRNCHALGGLGGERGPALDRVATRLTEDQLIRQVLQGGGNMPAYGNALSPAETTALVAFLKTCYPALLETD
jgi:ubiquinol-cytochrome c reductase cytochrome b subunit